MALVAIIASALYSAMHVAILAKRSATAAVEPTRAVVIAADLVRQDLESVLPPTGILAGAFQGTHTSGPAGGDNDSLVFYSIGEDSATIQREQQQEQQATQTEDPLAEG